MRESQSRTYLSNVETSRNDMDTMDVKITFANLLQQYINDRTKAHELVPINMGIDEPALSQRISEYNKLQLERDNNLKTTTVDNPLIQAYDGPLEKIRRDISEALNNVRNGYTIARNKILQQQRAGGWKIAIPSRKNHGTGKCCQEAKNSRRTIFIFVAEEI